MQIVLQFLCHARHKVWSFITLVISCTPPWAQTMDHSTSSMLLFLFNCQEKENKSPVRRHCKNTFVSCKQSWESGRKCCHPLVLRIDLCWQRHTTGHPHPSCLDNFVCNQFWLWNVNEMTARSACYTLQGESESLVWDLSGAVWACALRQQRGGSALVSGFLLILAWSLCLIRSVVLRQHEQQLLL